MATELVTDQFLELSVNKRAEALAILENPESGAEEVEKAEKMIAVAESMAQRSENILAQKSAMAAQFEAQQKQKQQQEKQEAEDKALGGSGFKSLGEFARAVWFAQNRPNVQLDPRLKYFNGGDKNSSQPVSRKALAENVGLTGGFLVPTEFRAQLLAVVGETAVVRPRATVIPMARRTIQIPSLDQTNTTAGVPAWYGGIVVNWTEEAGSKTEDSPDFKQVELTAHKMTLYTRSSDELLDDSAIALEAFLMGPMGFPGAIAWQEDYTFINGTGAGQPQGVIVAGGTITVNRAAQNAVSYADLANMVENFLPGANGVWVISQSLMSDLLQLNGPAGNPSYIWGSAVDGAPNRLLGYPVIWSEKNPRVGTAGDVILADWKYYLIGDRQATTIDTSIHDRFQYDQTSWRAVHRVDGQEWLSAPLTLQDGTSQVSPFVILGDKDT